MLFLDFFPHHICKCSYVTISCHLITISSNICKTRISHTSVVVFLFCFENVAYFHSYQDKLLAEAFELHRHSGVDGRTDWDAVSLRVGRDKQQCVLRWMTELHPPARSKSPWTEEEVRRETYFKRLKQSITTA